jgi:hypothetical protein
VGSEGGAAFVSEPVEKKFDTAVPSKFDGRFHYLSLPF